jgi:hypothetical protein
MIEKYIQENPHEYMTPIHDGLRKAAALKHRDILRESTHEYSKRGNFIRIFPAKNSDIYDQYFSAARPLNRILYKALFSDDIVRTSA